MGLFVQARGSPMNKRDGHEGYGKYKCVFSSHDEVDRYDYF